MRTDRREFLGLVAAGAAAGALRANEARELTQSAKDSADATAANRRGDPWLEINTANLVWNLRQIESRVQGKPVMAVVKANGYGHGIVGVARALEAAGVKHFLTGKLDEAQELRAAGIRGEILNFGPFSDSDAEEIVRLGITQNIHSEHVAALQRAADRLAKPARVQIKVDTGLGRFGVPHEKALEFAERVAAMRGVRIEGVFTTLTEDREFDLVQLSRLKAIGGRGVAGGASRWPLHAASSDAILELPAAYTELDMVRPGIMLYGLYPSERAEKERKLELKPALALKMRVGQVKTLRPGESASYHRAFTATQTERMATLAAGYSDGIPRLLAGKGSVLIGGRRCAIVAVTSNAVMVRLDEAPASPGDEAVLIGTQGGAVITTSEVAAFTGNSVYSVVMGMSGLVPREFVTA